MQQLKRKRLRVSEIARKALVDRKSVLICVVILFRLGRIFFVFLAKESERFAGVEIRIQYQRNNYKRRKYDYAQNSYNAIGDRIELVSTGTVIVRRHATAIIENRQKCGQRGKYQRNYKSKLRSPLQFVVFGFYDNVSADNSIS